MKTSIRLVTIIFLAVVALPAFCAISAPGAVALTPTPTPSSLKSQADALLEEAITLHTQEDYADAQKKAEAALVLYHQMGDDEGRVHANILIGLAQAGQGDLKEALEALQTAATIAHTADYTDGVTAAYGMLLGVYLAQEDYTGARTYFEAELVRYPAAITADTAQYYVGESLYYAERHVEAIQAYKQVLDNYPASDWADDAQFDIGACYYKLGDCQHSIEEMEQLLSRYPSTEYAEEARKAIPQCRADALYDRSRYQEALEKYRDALTYYREAKDREGESTTLNNIGEVYRHLGQYQEALRYYQQAVNISREIEDQAGEGITLSNIGLTYRSLGQYQEALRYYQQALDIFREVGDRAGEGITVDNIGAVYHSLGQYQEALKYYQQALEIRRQAGDRAGEGATLDNIGAVYHRLGQYQKALQYVQQALEVHREIGDQASEGATLDNIGEVYHNLGQYQRALEYVQQALDIRREIGDRAGEAITLGNIGIIYHSLGQYQEALRHFQQALDIAREIEDWAGEGGTLAGIGLVYHSLGQYEEALEYYQQALEIHQEGGNRASEAITLGNIGAIYQSLGQYQEALKYHQQALDITREIGGLADEGGILAHVGADYRSLGQYQEALQHLQQALDIFREVGDWDAEGTTLSNIGMVYHSLGQYQEALKTYQEALDIVREVGDRASEASTLSNIGYLYEQQGQFEQALDFYQQAIAVHEAIRTYATIEEFKTALTGQTVGVYRHVTLLLLKLGRLTEAFDITERARARTFLDQLANAHISPTAGGDPALIQQEEQLRGEIQALDGQLREEWAKPKDQRHDQVIQSLTTQLETKRAEYAQLLQTLKLNNPEYASLVTVDPLTLTDTQKILTDTTLIKYFVTAEQTVAFVVTQDNFHALQITVTQESLVEILLDFYLFPSLEDVPVPMKTLYQQLIAPLRPHIKTDLVCIVPHGVLHYLPFGALHDGEHYLVEEYTLFYAPSASVLPFAFEKRKSSVAPPLVLGDPDGSLPNSRQEAQAIAQLYDVPAHVGTDALERLLWEEGQDAGIIHLSTHGVYNDRSPLFSRVLLAPDDEEDGNLEVYEIYNRGLNLAKADLVVLSACQTNVGELSRGDEIVGLSRALIYAGSPSVIASLWSVSDESTRVLMEKFYTHLQEGMSKAEALRAAQMEMIVSDKYAHPYHWAAFGVTGDPGIGNVVPPWLTVETTPLPTEPATAQATLQTTPIPETTPTAGKKGGGICGLPLAAIGVLIVGGIGWRGWRRK